MNLSMYQDICFLRYYAAGKRRGHGGSATVLRDYYHAFLQSLYTETGQVFNVLLTATPQLFCVQHPAAETVSAPEGFRRWAVGAHKDYVCTIFRHRKEQGCIAWE